MLIGQNPAHKGRCEKKNVVFLSLASGRQMVNSVIGTVARFLSQSELLTGPESIFCLPSRYRKSKVKEMINKSINKI